MGLCAINAVCERFEVDSRFDGRVWRIVHERGCRVEPFARVGTSDRTGLRVRLHADRDIFSSTTFEPWRIGPMLEDLAMLHPLLEVRFQGAVLDNREGVGGAVARDVSDHVSAFAVVEGCLVDVAVGFGERGDGDLRFFVNGERAQHGDHVRGFWEGIGDAAGVKSSIAREILEPGLVAVVNVSPCARLAVRRVVGDLLKPRFVAEPLAALRGRDRARRPAR